MSIRKTRRTVIIALLITVGILCVLLGFKTAISDLDKGRDEKAAVQLEESIRRAAVACYAAEGRYPPNLDYIKEHYGVRVNEEAYTVFYEVDAENLMPDITVLENNEGQ